MQWKAGWEVKIIKLSTAVEPIIQAYSTTSSETEGQSVRLGEMARLTAPGSLRMTPQ